MWNVIHGTTQTSLFGMSFLGNHPQYIALFLAPIYAVFPHPLTLIVLKILSYTVGAFALYKIAQKNLGWLFAIAFMILYFIHPANIFSLCFEFDFESLAISLLFLAFYFFTENKFWPFCITVFFAALTKENIPLVVIAFGVYALFSKKRNKLLWSLVPILYGLAVFYFAMFIATPHLRPPSAGANAYLSFYKNLGSGPAGIIKTILLHPDKVTALIITRENLKFIMELFGPLIAIAFLSPHVLFLISPVILQYLLSAAPTQHTIYFHYAATIVPFVFLASVSAFSFIRKKLRPSFYYLLFIVIAYLAIFNVLRYQEPMLAREGFWIDRLDTARWQLIRQIPKDASVIATFSFLPELSQRKNLYTLYSVWDGKNIFTGQKPYPLVEKVDYAFIDFNDPWLLAVTLSSSGPGAFIPRVANFLSDKSWRVLDTVENIVLLKREKMGGIPLVQSSQRSFLPESGQPELSVDNKFSLSSLELNKKTQKRGLAIPLTLYWKCQEDIHENYEMIFIVSKNGKRVLKTAHRIGYTLCPTTIWKKGDCMKEYFSLSLPRLERGNYILSIVFVNQNQGKLADLTYPDQSTGKGVIFTLANFTIN